MRHALTLIAASLLALSAQAQTASQTGPQGAPAKREALQEREQAEGRRNQKVERMVHEDAGSRIEETRYGGQGESITVKPKDGMPAYEVDPAPLSRSRPADNRNGLSSAGGQRSWNVLSF